MDSNNIVTPALNNATDVLKEKMVKSQIHMVKQDGGSIRN